MQGRGIDNARLVEMALAEDIGAGDFTTFWTVPAGKVAKASIVAKSDGIIAGTAIADETFRQVDSRVVIHWIRKDGDPVEAGDEVARIEGRARSILMAERVALNFLQRLSGIATLTSRFVAAIEGTGARILDTRKTTPGYRRLERAAVRAGGGTNHRFGLDDMILIKENHIRAAGGIRAAVSSVRQQNSRNLEIEIEATTMDEVRKALEAGVDRILFDNMSVDQLQEAVEAARGSVKTEASGGVTLDTVRAIAGTGVDFISVGALTHSVPAFDLSLLFDFSAE